MRLLALVADTFREIYAKKVIVGMIVIQVITLVITGLILFSDGMQGEYRETARGARSNDSLDDAGTTAARNGISPGDSSLLGKDTALPYTTVYSDTTAKNTAGSASLSDTATPSAQTIHVDGRAQLVEMVKGEMSVYAGIVAFATVFLGIFAVAGLIPSLMEKGTIDLVLSKPLSRITLLLGRAFGGILAIAINLTVFTFAVFILYGLASGVWLGSFITGMLVIPMFTFVVISSGVILLNVYTESWILPLCLAYLHLMVLANMLFAREEFLFRFISSEPLQWVISLLYNVLPQTNDLLAQSVSKTIYTGTIDHPGSFVQGLVFSAISLSWAAWKFERKDF